MKKILFVEDDPILGPVYQRQLTDAGFEAFLAKDGEAGLQAVKQNRPDLLLLDIVLPRVTGPEFLKVLRNNPDTSSLPVIVLTGTFQQTILDDVNQYHPDRVLQKSNFAPDEVIEIIHEILNTKSDPPSAAVPASKLSENVLIRTQLKESLEKCRHMMLEVNKQSNLEIRAAKLLSLAGFVHSLSSGASAAGLKGQAYFCEALEALIEDVADEAEKLNQSNMRTITQAVDFLFEEFNFGKSMDVPEDLGFDLLVVDDDAISRRGISVALGRINQKPIETASAKEALAQAGSKAFDLIFLDVDMPEMSGFDVCTEIRRTDLNKQTPVIFVTGLSDLQSRAQSMLSGGTDFIVKPFEFMELAVKSLIHLLRRRLK